MCCFVAATGSGLETLSRNLLRHLLERGKENEREVRVFDPQNLVHLADRGDAAAVSRLIKRHPEKVNSIPNLNWESICSCALIL